MGAIVEVHRNCNQENKPVRKCHMSLSPIDNAHNCFILVEAFPVSDPARQHYLYKGGQSARKKARLRFDALDRASWAPFLNHRFRNQRGKETMNPLSWLSIRFANGGREHDVNRLRALYLSLLRHVHTSSENLSTRSIDDGMVCCSCDSWACNETMPGYMVEKTWRLPFDCSRPVDLWLAPRRMKMETLL